MDIISDTQTEILSLLGRFKFVTISQMLPKLDRSASYVRQQLANLSSRGYIKSQQLSKTLKTEAMYFLTEAGKELIVQHSKVFDTDIKVPLGVPLIVKDFEHRKGMVSLNMALYYYFKSMGISVIEMLSYFDKQGNSRKSGNLEARTKIPISDTFFIPDGILVTEKDGKKFLFLLENYCDNASTRVLSQIEKHMLAVAEGSPGKKFGLQANPIVICAFQNDGIKKKVIEKLRANQTFQPFKHLFLFGTLQEVIMQNCSNAFFTTDNIKMESINNQFYGNKTY